MNGDLAAIMQLGEEAAVRQRGAGLSVANEPLSSNKKLPSPDGLGSQLSMVPGARSQLDLLLSG